MTKKEVYDMIISLEDTLWDQQKEELSAKCKEIAVALLQLKVCKSPNQACSQRMDNAINLQSSTICNAVYGRNPLRTD